MSILDFRSAADGASVPDSAAVTDIAVAGKTIKSEHADFVGEAFGRWAEQAQASVVSLLFEVAKRTKIAVGVEEIAPGGRARDDIAPGLLKGKKSFTAQPDMYGPPPTVG